MKAFILSVANVRQDRFNTVYPNVRAISNVEGLSQAVKFDHMAGTFKNNRRANNSFISANCLIMDCDNGETDDSSKWITPESISNLVDSFLIGFLGDGEYIRSNKVNELRTMRIGNYLQQRVLLILLYNPISFRYIKNLKDISLEIL